jgi:hypothetical protein
VVVEVKALACSLPAELGLPLARFSIAELRRETIARGIVAAISGSTLWRWLDADAIRPWRHRSWIFPRDPDFAAKAGRVLDLYAGRWQGRPLGDDELVICADEKPSIQVTPRRHRSLAPGPGRAMRVEHEYRRRGTLAYLAAWDVRRGRPMGRCEPTTGIAPFERLVAQVMTVEPYASARHVFWVVDNGASHRGRRSVARTAARWPTIELVHLPLHASWLNQAEVYFSIVQRKVLTPSAWDSPADLERRLLAFEQRVAATATPFDWQFTRRDLQHLLARLPAPETLAA